MLRSTFYLNKGVILLSAVSWLGPAWENMACRGACRGGDVLPAALYEPGAEDVREAEVPSALNYLPVKTLFSGSGEAKEGTFF